MRGNCRFLRNDKQKGKGQSNSKSNSKGKGNGNGPGPKPAWVGVGFRGLKPPANPVGRGWAGGRAGCARPTHDMEP